MQVLCFCIITVCTGGLPRRILGRGEAKGMDRSRDQSEVSRTWPGYVLVLLTLLPALYLTQELSGLSSGTGGQEWKIGPPVATLNNSYQRRSLLELRRFALQLVNRDRTVNGLAPLVEDPRLSQTAEILAQDTLSQQFVARQPLAGNTSDRLNLNRDQLDPDIQSGVDQNTFFRSGSRRSGLTYGEVEKNQKSWMYSLESRENILGSGYTRFGYSIVADPAAGHQVAAQIFAGPKLRK